MLAPGLLVLRLTLAVLFVAHGSNQWFGSFSDSGIGAGGLAATAARFSAVGLDPGMPMAIFAGGIQIAAGLLMGLGALTRWAALGLIAYLALDAWKAHLPWGFFLNWTLEPNRGHGIEHAVLLTGALTCLVLAGGGDLSIDGRRARSAASRASARARLRTRG
jgi:putative oxidoreductase